MLSNDNLLLLWEALSETGSISITNDNQDVIKNEFMNHAKKIDSENPNRSLEEKNMLFINQYVSKNPIQQHNNISIDTNESMFEKRLRARQEEFKQMMEPPKPKTLTIGESIKVEKNNFDIKKRLEDYQNSRKTERWMDYNIEKNTESGEEDNYTQNDEITLQFMNNLKSTPENNNRKVSFIEPPSDSEIKKADLLSELKELRRRVSNIINTLESNEIEI
tara:strand:+ start:504 stop:1163 length:660 start_codon:yes stop_codon:yes gene_type:complete